MDDLRLHDTLAVNFVVLGALVGSFLNVVIGRLPEDLSVVAPRSRCPHCLTPVRAWDNIPILSWLLLRGRCRGCGVAISARYPLVEFLTAVVFAALWLRLGPTAELLKWAVLGAMLLAIVFLDIDHWWIPDCIVFPGMVFAMLMALLPGGLGWQAALIGLFPAVLIFAVGWGFRRLTGREGLGLGDVKLLAMLGLALGLMPTLTVLVLASVQGALGGGVISLFGGHRGRSDPVPEPVTTVVDDPAELWEPPAGAVPFGPFLALAAFQVVLLPNVFLDGPQRLVVLLADALGALKV